MPDAPEQARSSWLSPLVHFSNNWISLIGVVVTTTGAIFWLFLLPVTLKGQAATPYIGILAFILIPAVFFLGLILIPAGMAFEQKRERRTGFYPASFPPLNWRNHEWRRLVYFVSVTTLANLVIASQVTYEAVNYMDSTTFCGLTCHTVMKPEYTAFQNSPHSRLECANCHIGAGASWFVRSKLSGVGQVFAVIFDNYPRPIPTPVHNLRPARETCETCHWPQKYGQDRVDVIWKYGDDEANTLTKTVLLVKIGGGNHGIGIHGTHLGPGVRIYYTPADESRQTINKVEYSAPGRHMVYNSPETPKGRALEAREMDCMDCHNRPAHAFQMPEAAVDSAMQAGSISSTLPFAKKHSVAILKANYSTTADAEAYIPPAFENFYRRNYPAVYAQRAAEVHNSAQHLLAVFNRNIFPEMRVTWGHYPNNIGHTDFPGCFRCHDGNHTSSDGKTISQDCSVCHSILATDEPNPKVLTELGIDSGGKQ